jgi:glycosyltransferase involved in cell wall biosynthesis
MLMPGDLRVLHILYTLQIGGAERTTTNLLAGLHELGCDARCSILSTPYGTELETELADRGIPTTYLNKPPGFRPGMYVKLYRLIRQFQPHVVNTHLDVLRYTLPPTMAANVPVLVHTLRSLAAEEAKGLERWLRKMTFDKRIIPVSVSQNVADTACELYQLPACRVIYNGIHTARFVRQAGAKRNARLQLGISEQDVVFICVARLHPVKNHEMLLQAFQQVLESIPNAWMLLVGGGPLQTELTARAQDPAFGGRLRILGPQDSGGQHSLAPQESVAELQWAADVAVLASTSEGLPGALTEAMAAGNAVICTDIGGMPELVLHGETGLVVPSGDAAALAAAMQKLAGDAELRNRMAAAGQQRAFEHFDYLACAKSYLSLYESALEGKRRPG